MAVPTLVVMPDRILNEAVKLRDDPYQVRAPGRVRLHQSGFFRSQTALLPQQWRELLVDLANIVQKGRRLHLFDFLAGSPSSTAMALESLTHTKGMARGIRITSFDCFHHHLKKFLSTVLKLVVKAIDMTDGDDRNNNPDQAKRAEAKPMVKPSVQPSDKKCDHACARSYPRTPRVLRFQTSEKTCLSSGRPRCNGDRVHEEVDDREHEEET